EGTAPDGPGWRVRVVPNLFPAFVPDPPRSGPAAFEDALLRRLPAAGRHEVVIASPRHALGLAELSEAEALRYFRAVRLRVRAHYDAGARYALMITNRGKAAGASLEHVHGQIAAMPILPGRVDEEMRAAAAHAARTGGDLYGEYLDRELSEGVRVVAENARAAAIVPFAARYWGETWILPKEPSSEFAQADDGLRDAAASLLWRVLRAFDARWARPPYNFFLHDGSPRAIESKGYRWHFELFPVFTTAMSFEAGTGSHINLILPEAAAAELRDAVGALDEERSE
ncbi:MAG: hypothetical protein K8I02_10205, partial [Candidatus Methylomirabilis sp.]|nr:hypothetical protein [Deltaproteobacteria bacterium]